MSEAQLTKLHCYICDQVIYTTTTAYNDKLKQQKAAFEIHYKLNHPELEKK